MSNKCPECNKGEIREEHNLGGTIFRRKKIITFYCTRCSFKQIREFKIKEEEYRAELQKKGVDTAW